MRASSRAAWLAAALGLLVIAALAVSLIEGRPTRLPGVALGSDVLLHIERAAAVFAIAVAILSVLAQAARGRLPTQLSTAGLAYEAADTAVTEASLEELRGQVEQLEAVMAALPGHVDRGRAEG